MWIRDLTRSIIAVFRSPSARMALLAAYYFAIIVALILMYAQGDFSSTDFVYQGF